MPEMAKCICFKRINYFKWLEYIWVVKLIKMGQKIPAFFEEESVFYFIFKEVGLWEWRLRRNPFECRKMEYNIPTFIGIL